MTYRELHLPFLENSCGYMGQCQGNTFQNTTTRKICTSQRYLKLMQSAVTSGSAALIGLSKNRVEIWAHALCMFRIHLPPPQDIQYSIPGCLTSPQPSPFVPRKSVACSFKTVTHKFIFFSDLNSLICLCCLCLCRFFSFSLWYLYTIVLLDKVHFNVITISRERRCVFLSALQDSLLSWASSHLRHVLTAGGWSQESNLKTFFTHLLCHVH